MVRLVRFMVGAAVGAAGALYLSRRRGGEMREHVRTRVREFLREQVAEQPAFRPRSRRRPARGLLLPLVCGRGRVAGGADAGTATPLEVVQPFVPFAGEAAPPPAEPQAPSKRRSPI